MMNRQRLDKVRENMKKAGLTQILVTSTASIYYLTDQWVEPHERMIALYIDLAGRTGLFANEIFGLKDSPDLPVIIHKDGESPVGAIAEFAHTGKLGIDKFWFSKFLIELLELNRGIEPVNGSVPPDEAREIKDAGEVALMRKNSQINDKVIGKAIASLHEGVRENELAEIVNAHFTQNGADYNTVQLVCFGPNGADPHHLANQTILKAGDSVIFDIFTPISRYWCDMTRTVFYKSVTERQRYVYDLVKRANETAISRIKPGVLISEIDKAARDVIEQGGFGQNFSHRLGHGIGLECHEPPDVSLASNILLETGMVFSVEPGIYLPGEFGVRIEDLVIVTATGCEVLNKYSKELQIIG